MSKEKILRLILKDAAEAYMREVGGFMGAAELNEMIARVAAELSLVVEVKL